MQLQSADLCFAAMDVPTCSNKTPLTQPDVSVPDGST